MAESEKLQQLKESVLSGNIPQLVLSMISHAIDIRSSDIHIEPQKTRTKIRFRVDGVLREIIEYPLNLHPAVVSRIKIMSELKIDEQRIPQDGRTHVTTKDGREMDLRVSTLPTVNGEKIVMRIQDKSKKIPDLPELGIEETNFKYFQEALASPNGIILTTGPTGSGKTTTLYSSLSTLNKPEVNILTIEDPVEIQMDGLNQSQVHPDINYTFAYGLRCALRQDPNIIMVGEIRDRETADIAIEASLTGHLVLSTIHTNNAVETITRIVNLGIPNYLLAATIELIIAQRLVRKLCPDCKKIVELTPDQKEHIEKVIEALPDAVKTANKDAVMKKQFYGPAGCEKCNNIGYLGRIGLYEMLRMNDEIRKLILENKLSIELEQAASRSGMLNLETDGVTKALKGITSIEEVYRVARKS
ncbi:type II/IV secretion system protein [Candidatus Peregrinibacteria bacterium]|nr:type II/IV secretion system protein [Candidatus Peregrinibacteria bacterium]